MTFVASTSSINVKKGINLDSVIVFVIAFFIPVSFFTSSSGFTPVRGAIFTTLSPTAAEPELEAAYFVS
jgi:hypothetical protein